MDGRGMRDLLADRLSEVNWGTGVGKVDLLERVAYDESLRNLIGQYVPEGTYLNAEAVLNVIPEQAWQDAQGDLWRGGTIASIAPDASNFREGPVGQDAPGATGGDVPGRLRQVAEQVTGAAQSAGQSAAALPGQARQALGAVTSKVSADDVRAQASESVEKAKELVTPLTQGAASVADRAKQAGAQGRDQVLSITTKVAERAKPAGEQPRETSGGLSDEGKRKQTAIPIALSTLMEGLGQAYNRQPIKASGFLVAGISLSTLSGLNTWLARNVFRAKGTRLGPERIRPLLLGLWALTFVLNLWDAWTTARSRRGANQAAGITASSGTESTMPQTWDDVALAGSTPASAATQSTDEFPTLSPT